MITAQKIETRLKELGSPKNVEQAQRFFKTGPGEYGEGDLFIGIRVPILRKLAKELSKPPSPACGHPSRGGDPAQSPPAEGCAKRGVGLPELSLDELIELMQSPF